MAILAKGEFDIAALLAKKASKQNKVDLVAKLREVAPEIEQLKVGETAQITVPGKTQAERKENLRKTVMSITAPLSHLCSKGGKWAGKDFKTVSDDEARNIYVQRGSNLKEDQIKERKKGGGGGRKKATTEGTNAPETTGPVAGEVEGNDQQQEQENLTPETAADTVAAGGSVEVVGGALVKEHA